MSMTTDLAELIDEANECICELELCMNLIADKLYDDQVCVQDLMALIEEMNSLVSDLERVQEELKPHRSISVVVDKLGEIDQMLSDPDIKEYRAAYDAISRYSAGYLINECYFEHYVADMAESQGEIHRDSWLFHYIDWARAAEDVKQDYIKISIGSEDYYVRN